MTSLHLSGGPVAPKTLTYNSLAKALRTLARGSHKRHELATIEVDGRVTHTAYLQWQYWIVTTLPSERTLARAQEMAQRVERLGALVMDQNAHRDGSVSLLIRMRA